MNTYDLDCPQLTHVSLCAGYGGIDLGLRRVLRGLRTVAYAEIEEYACGVLAARMENGQLDAAPIWTDVKSFPYSDFYGCVDILSAGYPCQPFSAAGKRFGKDDPRHLWPWIADGIAACQPGLVFFENVEGHVSMGLREVCGDLEGLGYQCAWGLFSAEECGAPHRRKRVFILAHDTSIGVQGYWAGRFQESFAHAVEGLLMRQGNCWPSRPGQPQFAWEPPRVVGNSANLQRDGGDDNAGSGQRSETVSQFGDTSGKATDERGQTQSALGGDADGPSHRLDYAELCVSGNSRVDELRLLGNGVVPATAALAFTTLAQRLGL